MCIGRTSSGYGELLMYNNMRVSIASYIIRHAKYDWPGLNNTRVYYIRYIMYNQY